MKGLSANFVGKAGRPFERAAVIVGVMLTAKRALVQLCTCTTMPCSCKHAWNLKEDTLNFECNGMAWHDQRKKQLRTELNEVGPKVQHVRAAWGHGMAWQGLMINLK